MLEKDFQVKFSHYLKSKWHGGSAGFELKICKIKRFNLKKIEKHQLANLYRVKHDLFYFKIGDYGTQNPFDCFVLDQAEAYLVLMFYRPRETKRFYMIDIDKIVKLIKNGAKSITENEASILADCIGILKN